MTLQARSQSAKPNLLLGMEKFIFWQRWLLVVGLILVDMGLYMIFLKGAIYFALFDNLVNPVFWASTTAPANVTKFQGYVYGAWGTTIVVWGTLLAVIAHYPFKQKEKWAWNCTCVVTLIWYLSTVFVSLQFNFVVNVVANTVMLILLMLPLVFTRKDVTVQGVSPADSNQYLALL
ncbi:MAG: hypothetical protein GY847_00165 [Proteobacteria bacterium]|nr:hypothetical protein [Pseudomonadota bacterium]